MQQPPINAGRGPVKDYGFIVDQKRKKVKEQCIKKR